MKWYIVKKLFPSSHNLLMMEHRYIVTNGEETYKFVHLDVAICFWSQIIADIPIDEIDLDTEFCDGDNPYEKV